MKIVLMIMTISCIFSQANYQILSTASNFKDIFEIDDFYDNYHYSIFNSLFPNDIDLFTFTISAKKTKNYNLFVTLKNLDYGEFTNSENNYNFNAKESLIKLSILKKNTIAKKIMLNLSYLKSTIDIYQSDAISADLLASFKMWRNHYFNIAFKNFGGIINSYSDTNIKLPSTFNFSYSFQNKNFPVFLFTTYKRRIDLKQENIQVTIKLNINEKLSLYLSNRNDKSDLFFGDYIDKMIAGTNIGITYFNNNNDLNLAFQNLGAAGYITSISFIRAIL